jgi:hypothetical protein
MVGGIISKKNTNNMNKAIYDKLPAASIVPDPAFDYII